MTEYTDELEMQHKLLEEFQSVTLSQAYYKIWCALSEGMNEGNIKFHGQNIDSKLWDVLNQSEICSPVRIMDFGGGDGETMAPIYRKLDVLNKEMIISVEEPHKGSLREYIKLIENIGKASIDIAYPGPLKNYLGHTVQYLRALKAYPQQLQDRVLAVHVLYHLTSIFDEPFVPYENMKQSISAMYAILKPGGQMVIVLDKNEDDLLGAASLKCSEVLFPHKLKNHKLLFEVWHDLLFTGGIADVLNASFPMFKATIQLEEVVRQVFLPTLAEVGTAVSIGCLIGLCDGQSPFDQRILQSCMDYVKTDGYKHGLYHDSGGMWCFPLKNHYIAIKKVVNT
ncbi:uncharacterized protein LOC106177666 [Lingula anatina]|uniref:Uncharacterized protein LOC106177666 n=1 Tax=Lingula anatina TaxID=7574 RepID=A0A1S3K0R5_LINAN|nr:uncharacterized protein LOC106177666 [Lingula anatina]|eukprot:XP_013415959.1 uncharacterized protein LOC106177666 [Lingula anatina]